MIEIVIYVFFLGYLASNKRNYIYILTQIIFFQLIGYLPFISAGLWDFRWLHTVLLFAIFLIFKIQYRFPKRLLKKVFFHPINVSIFCIIMCMLFHTTYTDLLPEGHNVVNKFIFPTYFLILVSIFTFSREIEVYKLIEGIVLGGFIVSALMLVKFASGSILTNDRMSIVAATEYNPIMIARSMGVILITSIILYYNQYKIEKFKYLYLFNILSSVFFILVTSTRTIFFSSAIIMVIYFFLSSKSIIDGLKFFSFIFVFGILVTLAINYGDFVVIERFQALNDYESLARYKGYVDAVSIFEDNKNIGVGPAGYYRLTGRQYPHNLILEVLCEYGTLGGIFLLTILFSGLKIAFRQFRKSKLPLKVIKLLWVYFLLNSMTSGYIASNREFWVISAILVSLYYIENNKQIKLPKVE